ncbi:MAG: 30S ribosomal protein S6 [Armatimonadetes bacterium]|nr:30S ribosomal protein S6 [Armatimonadota bacterium]
MVRPYEVLYIVHPDLTDEQITPITEKYKAVVEGQGGEVESINRWEKRRLAYEVKGQMDGIYVLMNYTGEPAVSAELDRTMKIGEDVLRHLIVRTDEV